MRYFLFESILYDRASGIGLRSIGRVFLQVHSRLIFGNGNQFEKRNKKFPQILEAMNSFDLSTKSKQSTRPIRTKRSIKRSPVLSTILIT